MPASIRKALPDDIDAVAAIYEAVHAATEAGRMATGWIRGVYPVRATARDALARGDLFVLEADGAIAGTGVINGAQLDVYRKAAWRWQAPDEAVMVLHTFMIDPRSGGKGHGRRFVEFYEAYALAEGRPYLRIDTNARNAGARGFYKKLGFREAGVFACPFQNLGEVELVMLEKKAGSYALSTSMKARRASFMRDW